MLKIYTRSGDDGTTALRGGKRVRKNSPLIEAYGSLDELNSAIGLARSLISDRTLDLILADIQNDLLRLDESAPVEKLERLIDEMQAKLPPLREFILPTGPLHFARAVCRRAERACVPMPGVVPYLNRLGDLLFVLARRANRGKETKVSPRRASRQTARPAP
jgi:cob(I)alamin adenosyltransferase